MVEVGNFTSPLWGFYHRRWHNRNGIESYLDLCRKSSGGDEQLAGEKFAEAVESIYGRSVAEFETEWRRPLIDEDPFPYPDKAHMDLVCRRSDLSSRVRSPRLAGPRRRPTDYSLERLELRTLPDSNSRVNYRGQSIYDADIRPKVDTPNNLGKMVIIAAESGHYVIDDIGLDASNRLYAKHP